jgi:hypothetical protein
MNRFPSLVEHRDYYNLRTEDVPAEVRGRPGICFRSAKQLPPLDLREFERMQELVYGFLHRHGRFPNLREDVGRFYEFCVGDELIDRTISVELPNFRVLTPAFIEGLQKEVLAENPLWRVHILTEEPGNAVMVYPNVVRVGVAPPSANVVAELNKAIEREVAARDVREGPDRRQLAYLAPKVREALKNLDVAPFIVLGVFDNCSGDTKKVTIWLLFRSEIVPDLVIEEPREIAVGTHRRVRPDGTLVPEFGRERTDVWLEQWVLPAGFGDKVVVQRREKGKPVVGQQWEVRIDRASIVRDADLLAKERRRRE